MLHLLLSTVSPRDILLDIPHDAASVAVYLMMTLFVGLIILGSRGGGSNP